MLIVTIVIVLGLLLCALAISSSLTRMYLQSKRKSDPSYDEYEDEEAREAGLPIIISRKTAEQGLPIFSASFMVCVFGIVCMIIGYYGLSITSAVFVLTSLFSIKRCIVIAIFLLLSYAVATTYFQKPKNTNSDAKPKAQEANFWSLFTIKFADVMQQKGSGSLYLDDAMAFYRTLGYFWIILLILLVIV
jgi:uncharacterized membrane protein